MESYKVSLLVSGSGQGRRKVGSHGVLVSEVCALFCVTASHQRPSVSGAHQASAHHLATPPPVGRKPRWCQRHVGRGGVAKGAGRVTRRRPREAGKPGLRAAGGEERRTRGVRPPAGRGVEKRASRTGRGRRVVVRRRRRRASSRERGRAESRGPR